MGNDSSVTSSVYGLNESLNKIEERLFQIEDIHLHHQTCFNVDNCVLISGKKIRCVTDVYIITGPVVGLVGSSRASVMIEVDQTTELSINIFRSDKYTIGERFIRSLSVKLLGNTPTTFVIEDLIPGIPYTVYFGGVNGEQIINFPARFITINEIGNNLKACSCHLGVSSGTDLSTYSSALDEIRNSRNDDDSSQLFLMGNSISISKTIEIYFKSIWESLHTIDGSERWQQLIAEFERDVRNKYREFFRQPSVLRLCSAGAFIPIAGAEESGRLCIEFILKGIIDASNDAMTSFDSVLPGSPISASPPKNISSVASGAGSSWATKKMRKIQEASSQKTSTVVQALHVSAAAELTELGQTASLDLSEKVELQKLILFLLASIGRLVYSQYFRQLWDSQFPAMKDLEERILFMLKNVLKLRSKIWKHNCLLQQLLINKKKYLEKFQHDDVATEEAIKFVQIEVQAAKQKVVSYLQAVNELRDLQCVDWSEPKLLTLGSGVLFAVFDTEWFWLQRSLELKLPLNKPCSVPETAMKRIKEVLKEEIVGADGEQPKRKHEEIKNILCILPQIPLDPHRDWLESLLPCFYNEIVANSSISLAEKDFRRLMLEISLWQRQLESRCALLLCAASYSLSGEAFYYVDHEPDLDLVDTSLTKDVSECITARETVQALIAGRICAPQEQMFSFIHQRQWLLVQRRAKAIKYECDGKLIYVLSRPTNTSGYSGVWSAQLYPRMDPLSIRQKQKINVAINNDMKDTFLANVNRDFSAFSSTLLRIDKSEPLLIGMRLGRVTSTRCTVLVETGDTCSLALICEDSLTGLQFCSRQVVIASRPSTFVFSQLHPQRHYHVYLQTALSNRSVLKSHYKSFVSFTTPAHYFSSMSLLPAHIQDAENRVTENGSDTTEIMKILFLPTENYMERIRTVSGNQASRDASSLLESIRTGFSSLKELSLLLGQPWCGVDLVLHSRCPIDLIQYLPQILSLLHLAESYLTVGLEGESHAAVSQAEETLRECFRKTMFGDTTYSRLFQVGGHFLPIVSTLDILRSCGVGDIDSLHRELSVYVCSKLEILLKKIAADYISAPWIYESQIGVDNLARNDIVFLAPEVLLVEINTDFKTSLSSGGGRLISTLFLDSLRYTLHNKNTSVLILSSPIPFFDKRMTMTANLSYEPIKFLDQDVIALMDVLLGWVLGSSNTDKSILILCASESPIPSVLDITVEQDLSKFKVSDDAQKMKLTTIKVFRQICFCPFPEECNIDSWRSIFHSKEFPNLFAVCSPSLTSHKKPSLLLGFEIITGGNSVDVNVVDETFFKNMLQQVNIPKIVTNLLDQSAIILQQLFGDDDQCKPLNEQMHCNLEDMKEYKDIIDKIISSHSDVINDSFREFCDGSFCDLSSSLSSTIEEGLLFLCRGIICSLDPSLQDLLGFPSIIGIRLAWKALSCMITGDDSSLIPLSRLIHAPTFNLFVKMVLFSRFLLDNICRENCLID